MCCQKKGTPSIFDTDQWLSFQVLVEIHSMTHRGEGENIQTSVTSWRLDIRLIGFHTMSHIGEKFDFHPWVWFQSHIKRNQLYPLYVRPILAWKCEPKRLEYSSSWNNLKKARFQKITIFWRVMNNEVIQPTGIRSTLKTWHVTLRKLFRENWTVALSFLLKYNHSKLINCLDR